MRILNTAREILKLHTKKSQLYHSRLGNRNLGESQVVSAECRENKDRTSAAENKDPRKLSSRNEVGTDLQGSQYEDSATSLVM